MFSHFARWASKAMGQPAAFAIALAACVVWLIMGPVFGMDSSWQLVVLNHAATSVTVLMVFLVQHTQNHHNEAVQIKLDELIRAIDGAHNVMVDLEDLSPEKLEAIKARYRALAQEVRSPAGAGNQDTSTPAIEPMPEGERGAR